MENKFYVSYEAARLLKEKGYNKEVEMFYNDIGVLREVREFFQDWECLSNDRLDNNRLSAPSKAEAIDWLESKGIVVVLCRVTPIYMGYAGEKEWSFDLEFKESGKYDGCLRYSTRLEAEDAAIIKALELL